MNTLINNLGLASVQFAFWAAILFVVGYTILARWWKSELGWARVSLDIGIAMALSPTLLHVVFGVRVEDSIAFAWYQIAAITFVGCVSLWNLALVIRTQLKNRKLGEQVEPTAPSITSIVFDKPQYVTGQTINVTVTYVPGTSAATHVFTGTVTDGATGLTGQLPANFILVINDSTVPTASDSGDRTWTKISDTGTVAVFQAIA